MTVGVVEREDHRDRWLGRLPARPPTTWSTTRRATPGRRGPTHRVPLSASGQAVAGGKLYAIGGCTTAACTPMSNDVAAYDPATDTWEPWPTTRSRWRSRPAAGSTAWSTAPAATTARPARRTATPTTRAPTRGRPIAGRAGRQLGQLVRRRQRQAASSTAASQGGVITNAGFAYDPATGAWSDLPNSNTARYRGGAACGFYKIGGSSGGFTATVDSEVLPGLRGLRQLGGRRQWMTHRPHRPPRWHPGASVTVSVTMDPNVAQPGTYTARSPSRRTRRTRSRRSR